MTTIQKLFDTYLEGFAPPQWIKKFIFSDKYLKSTVCYYDKGNKKEEVEQLLTLREPVNINMIQLYHEDLLMDYFGYKKSVYDSNSPNIAVYCYTPIKIKTIKSNIHVLNVIGVALDNMKQPDFIRIVEKGRDEYIKMVCLVFKKIKYCFMTKNFKRLVLHGFGLGNYAKYATMLGIDVHKVFQVAFNEIFADINPKWGKEIVFNNIDIIVDYPVIHQDKYLDALILKYRKENQLEHTLFINAWDPFSMIGNGNEMDDSLDGYFGRISAMSILGWPITNKQLSYQEVGDINIYYSDTLDYKDPLFIQFPFDMIWDKNQFVYSTKQLIQKAKKYKKTNDYEENERLKDFLQKPFDISKLKIPPFENDILQWSLEMKKSVSDSWTLTTLTLYEFPKQSPENIVDLKDYPYRINNEQERISIPFLYHTLMFTDLQGIMLNTEWFHQQIEYIKKLKADDQRILYDYSLSPNKVNDRKARLQKIIMDSPRLLNPIIVWRGINKNYFKQYTTKHGGDTYDNKYFNHFQSTSIDPNIAYNNFMGYPCCLCQMLLMPNTPCLFLGISALSYEREILLPLDIKFKIVDNTVDIKNCYYKTKNKMIRMYSIV